MGAPPGEAKNVMCEGGRRSQGEGIFSAQHAPSAPRVSALPCTMRTAERTGPRIRSRNRARAFAFVDAETMQVEPFDELESAARKFALGSRKTGAMPPDGLSVVGISKMGGDPSLSAGRPRRSSLGAAVGLARPESRAASPAPPRRESSSGGRRSRPKTPLCLVFVQRWGPCSERCAGSEPAFGARRNHPVAERAERRNNASDARQMAIFEWASIGATEPGKSCGLRLSPRPSDSASGVEPARSPCEPAVLPRGEKVQDLVDADSLFIRWSFLFVSPSHPCASRQPSSRPSFITSRSRANRERRAPRPSSASACEIFSSLDTALEFAPPEHQDFAKFARVEHRVADALYAAHQNVVPVVLDTGLVANPQRCQHAPSVAGLFGELAQRGGRGLFTAIDHSTRGLEGHRIHAVPVLPHQDETAIRGLSAPPRPNRDKPW